MPQIRFAKYKLNFLLALIAPIFILTGCLETIGREPLPAIQSGSFHVIRIQVAKHPSIKSDTLVNRVARELRKQAQENLNGKSPVILQVLIRKWKTPGKRLGGSMAQTLFGTTSELSGYMRIYDSKEMTLIHEQEIITEFSEKGFFSDQAPSESDEVRRLMTQRFATMVVGTVK